MCAWKLLQARLYAGVHELLTSVKAEAENV